MGTWIMWINKDKNTTSILTQNKTLLSNPPLLSLYAFLFLMRQLVITLAYNQKSRVAFSLAVMSFARRDCWVGCCLALITQ